MYEKIPQELKALPQWVGWKYIQKEGKEKPDKVPFNPNDGSWAKSNDAGTWGTFEKAAGAVARYNLSGIGIMFANNIFGVDIDHCYEDGSIKAFAQEIIDTVQSYTELSPSGTGIHILCRGELPKGGRKKGDVEMYCAGRFFTVTGNQYGEDYQFSDCTERVKAMHEKYLGGEPAITPASRKPPLRTDYMGVNDILERAFRSKNGDKFRDLYNGDWEKHITGPDYSQSVADQTFCGMLAFWCRCDASLMDAIFQQSALIRPKWASRRGATTYGNQTIQKAISQCGKVWNPPQMEAQPDPAPPPERPGEPHPQSPPLPPQAVSGDTPAEDEPLQYYQYDDTGNAQRFRAENLGAIRFNYIDDCWLYWDGRRWAQDETGEIKRKADAMLDKMKDELSSIPEDLYSPFKKHISRSRSHRGKEAFISEAKHLDRIPLLPAELDRPGNAFNTKSGIVSLKTGVIKEHNKDLMLSKLAPVTYDVNAKCPLWDKFIDDITCHSEELKLYIQRMIGYCLTASTVEQCMFFLYGNGSNGKSTFVDTIATMMGEYASSCQPETVMLRDRNNTARSDLARLKGARLVVTSEPNDGCRLDEGIVKQMTGGTENKLTARFLYGKEFEFSPEFKIIMSTNYKPVIKGTDNGIWRRIRLIPFAAQFSDKQKDKLLSEKLRREMSGILNWAVAGAVGWYRHGLPPCPLVDTAVQEYRSEMDRIQQFIDDCLYTDKESSLQAAKLYHVYKGWCSEQGDRYPIANVKFSVELKKRFTVKKTSACNEYLGISFSEHGAALAVLSSKD